MSGYNCTSGEYACEWEYPTGKQLRGIRGKKCESGNILSGKSVEGCLGWMGGSMVMVLTENEWAVLLGVDNLLTIHVVYDLG